MAEQSLGAERAAKELEPCSCGRTKPHCPRCGKSSLYAVDRLNVEVQIGDRVVVDGGFRCKSCGYRFRQSTLCTAPELVAAREDAKALADTSEEAKRQRRAAIAVMRSVGQAKSATELERKYREQGLI
jgi:hypothetical protein